MLVSREQSRYNAMTLFLGRKMLNTSIVNICEKVEYLENARMHKTHRDTSHKPYLSSNSQGRQRPSIFLKELVCNGRHGSELKRQKKVGRQERSALLEDQMLRYQERRNGH
jgi:hypothetical protein